MEDPLHQHQQQQQHLPVEVLQVDGLQSTDVSPAAAPIISSFHVTAETVPHVHLLSVEEEVKIIEQELPDEVKVSEAARQGRYDQLLALIEAQQFNDVDTGQVDTGQVDDMNTVQVTTPAIQVEEIASPGLRYEVRQKRRVIEEIVITDSEKYYETNSLRKSWRSSRSSDTTRSRPESVEVTSRVDVQQLHSQPPVTAPADIAVTSSPTDSVTYIVQYDLPDTALKTGKLPVKRKSLEIDTEHQPIVQVSVGGVNAGHVTSDVTDQPDSVTYIVHHELPTKKLKLSSSGKAVGKAELEGGEVVVRTAGHVTTALPRTTAVATSDVTDHPDTVTYIVHHDLSSAGVTVEPQIQLDVSEPACHVTVAPTAAASTDVAISDVTGHTDTVTYVVHNEVPSYAIQLSTEAADDPGKHQQQQQQQQQDQVCHVTTDLPQLTAEPTGDVTGQPNTVMYVVNYDVQKKTKKKKTKKNRKQKKPVAGETGVVGEAGEQPILSTSAEAGQQSLYLAILNYAAQTEGLTNQQSVTYITQYDFPSLNVKTSQKPSAKTHLDTRLETPAGQSVEVELQPVAVSLTSSQPTANITTTTSTPGVPTDSQCNLTYSVNYQVTQSKPAKHISSDVSIDTPPSDVTTAAAVTSEVSTSTASDVISKTYIVHHDWSQPRIKVKVHGKAGAEAGAVGVEGGNVEVMTSVEGVPSSTVPTAGDVVSKTYIVHYDWPQPKGKIKSPGKVEKELEPVGKVEVVEEVEAGADVKLLAAPPTPAVEVVAVTDSEPRDVSGVESVTYIVECQPFSWVEPPSAAPDVELEQAVEVRPVSAVSELQVLEISLPSAEPVQHSVEVEGNLAARIDEGPRLALKPQESTTAAGDVTGPQTVTYIVNYQQPALTTPTTGKVFQFKAKSAGKKQKVKAAQAEQPELTATTTTTTDPQTMTYVVHYELPVRQKGKQSKGQAEVSAGVKGGKSPENIPVVVGIPEEQVTSTCEPQSVTYVVNYQLPIKNKSKLKVTPLVSAEVRGEGSAMEAGGVKGELDVQPSAAAATTEPQKVTYVVHYELPVKTKEAKGQGQVSAGVKGEKGHQDVVTEEVDIRPSVSVAAATAAVAAAPVEAGTQSDTITFIVHYDIPSKKLITADVTGDVTAVQPAMKQVDVKLPTRKQKSAAKRKNQQLVMEAGTVPPGGKAGVSEELRPNVETVMYVVAYEISKTKPQQKVAGLKVKKQKAVAVEEPEVTTDAQLVAGPSVTPAVEVSVPPVSAASVTYEMEYHYQLTDGGDALSGGVDSGVDVESPGPGGDMMIELQPTVSENRDYEVEPVTIPALHFETSGTDLSLSIPSAVIEPELVPVAATVAASAPPGELKTVTYIVDYGPLEKLVVRKSRKQTKSKIKKGSKKTMDVKVRVEPEMERREQVAGVETVPVIKESSDQPHVQPVNTEEAVTYVVTYELMPRKRKGKAASVSSGAETQVKTLAQETEPSAQVTQIAQVTVTEPSAQVTAGVNASRDQTDSSPATVTYVVTYELGTKTKMAKVRTAAGPKAELKAEPEVKLEIYEQEPRSHFRVESQPEVVMTSPEVSVYRSEVQMVPGGGEGVKAESTEDRVKPSNTETVIYVVHHEQLADRRKAMSKKTNQEVKVEAGAGQEVEVERGRREKEVLSVELEPVVAVDQPETQATVLQLSAGVEEPALEASVSTCTQSKPSPGSGAAPPTDVDVGVAGVETVTYIVEYEEPLTAVTTTPTAAVRLFTLHNNKQQQQQRILMTPLDNNMEDTQSYSTPVTSLTVSSSQRHFVVVAIDFGTTFSGYAFSFSPALTAGKTPVRDGKQAEETEATSVQPDSVHVMRRWEGGDPGVVNHKAPTTLLLTPAAEFHSFGFTARDFYHDLSPRQAKKWLYFDKFKMILHNDADLNSKTEIQASNGQQVLAATVFIHALRFFRKHALQEISDQCGTKITTEDIRWVITVPSIWREPAKQFMRQAAYQAGIGSADRPEQLVMALEPEAASIYVRRLHLHQLIPVGQEALPRPRSPRSRLSLTPEPRTADVSFQTESLGQTLVDVQWTFQRHESPVYSTSTVADQVDIPGTRYMVVDCGGGTVDITVHELSSSSTLIELYKATGGPFGSTAIDCEFERLLVDIFGSDFIDVFKLKRPAGWVDLMMAFESRKRAANPLNNKALNVSLPFSFIDYHKKFKNCPVETAIRCYGNSDILWSSQGMLRLLPGAMKRLFQPTLDNIKQAIGNVLNHPSVKGLKFLFLVGGFAESAMLQMEVRNEFQHLLKIIIPHEVSLAVLRGAVCFGVNPDVVTTRRSLVTYGVGVIRPFIRGRDPASKLLRQDNRDWCTDVFDVLVLANQPVHLGQTIVRRYMPAISSAHQTTGSTPAAVFDVYCSDHDAVMYTTDSGVKQCGTLRLEFQNVITDTTEIQIRVNFSSTEITVTAVDTLTDKYARATIDFLSK